MHKWSFEGWPEAAGALVVVYEPKPVKAGALEHLGSDRVVVTAGVEPALIVPVAEVDAKLTRRCSFPELLEETGHPSVAGHLSNIEQPDKFIPMLRSFLSPR